MKPPMRIFDATSVLSLQQEIQRSVESRYDHRLLAVLLVAQGMTCPEVARLLESACRNWRCIFSAVRLASSRPPETCLTTGDGWR